jgi:hypothetical protein|tara:strand:+ start:3405 stop:3797 length:393 start_codon:yes stop_codon:yes gene_type:complete
VIALNFFGKKAKFHHIGVVVKSIKDVSPASEIIVDSVQKVHVSLVQLHGIKLEFIEPSGDDSPVIKSLKEGTKLVHICYTVDDIEKAINECRNHGFLCISLPVPSAAFKKNIVWVYSEEYGLFELLEEGK